MPQDLLSRRSLDFFFPDCSARAFRHDGSCAVTKFDLALPQSLRRIIWKCFSDFVKAGFLATGAGVEDKDLHLVYLARTVNTGQGAAQTTRYDSVERNRSVKR